MAVTFMTNDQWAQKKGFTQFLADSGSGYIDKNTYPTAAGLDLMREEAQGEMLDYIPGDPDTTTFANKFRRMEYGIVELMIDEEQGRETEDGRPIYVPRDYLTPNQQEELSGMGSTFNRGTGN